MLLRHEPTLWRVTAPAMAGATSTSAALVIAALVWLGPALAFQGDVRAGQVRGMSLTGVVLLTLFAWAFEGFSTIMLPRSTNAWNATRVQDS